MDNRPTIRKPRELQPPRGSNYSITIQDAELLMESAMKKAQGRSDITYKLDRETTAGTGVYATTSSEEKKDQRGVAVIGTKELYSMAERGCVDNRLLAATIRTIFHEEGHAIQVTDKYQNHRDDPEVTSMMRDQAISLVFPEYHEANYWNSINEMDAERHGLIEAQKFFREHAPDFKGVDMEQSLCEFNNWQDEYNIELPVKSIQETVDKLDKKIRQRSAQTSSLPPLTLSPVEGQGMSLMPLMKQSRYHMGRLEKAENLEQQQKALCEYIYSYDRSYFQNCRDILPTGLSHLASSHMTRTTADGTAAKLINARTVDLPDSLSKALKRGEQMYDGQMSL